MKKLLPIIIFLAPYFATAQDFIITDYADTLYGKVSLEAPGELTEMVEIKIGQQNLSFHSLHVVSLRIDSTDYKSIRMDPRYRIMKQIVPGYLSLYKYRYDKSYAFAANYLYKATGEGIEIPSLTFRATVSNFLEECPQIQDSIKSKAYKQTTIDQLVRDYNKICVDREPQQEVATTTVDLRELNQLLEDIRSKQEAKQPVPAYLISTLKAMYEKNPSKEAKKVLKELGEN